MAEPAVSAQGLEKHFGDFVAVEDLSFDIQPGEVYGFLGPNGSGKSTTIRMLCGLLRPTRGDACIDGFSVKRKPEEVKRRIGYMSQLFSLYGDLTVQENLEFYAGVYSVSKSQLSERSKALFERLALGEFEERLTRTLSTGVRQRLALACALIHKPRILFLDEPTSGVDPLVRRLFFDLISELAGEGVTTLITTHVMEEAEYCNRLLLIYQSRKVTEGTPAELRALVPGKLFEVKLPDALEAQRALLGLPEILDASLFGSSLHVVLSDAVTNPETRLRELLGQRGYLPESLRPVRRSMEHAFLYLTGDAVSEGVR